MYYPTASSIVNSPVRGTIKSTFIDEETEAQRVQATY